MTNLFLRQKLSVMGLYIYDKNVFVCNMPKSVMYTRITQ